MASNIFKQMASSGGIFRDESVLQPDFLPEEMPGRERQMRDLASFLQPVTRNQAPSSVLIVGSPGLGKTTMAKLVLKQLGEVSKRALPIYINCWETSTRFGILNELVTALGDMLPRRGIAVDEVVARLKEIGRREQCPLPIVVLDEVDRLLASNAREDQVLYDLSRSAEALGLPCAVIGITNDVELPMKLDARVRSSLTNHVINFSPYNPTELKSILGERAKRAFQPSALDSEVIPLCAAVGAKAGGDARISIHLLWAAARAADSEGASKVGIAHVKAMQASALEAAAIPASRKINDLDEMDRKLVQLISKSADSGLSSGELYAKLKAGEAEQRTLRNRLARLEKGGLITGEEIDKAGGHTRRWKIRKTA